MPSISKHHLTLLLLGVGAEGGISEGLGGITRLQKYLYLLEKEGGITSDGGNFQFEAYKAGPYSSKLYDDLEFLENLGLIQSEVTAQATVEEATEIEELTFGDLMGDGAEVVDGEQYDGFGASDACEERRFILTGEGRRKVEALLANAEYRPVVNAIRKIKSRFSNHSLSDLLYYVYTKYPDMTTESEIKDKVLRRGRNQ
jgi:uncharacterized protein YwgA